MNELDVFDKLNEIGKIPQYQSLSANNSELAAKVAKHKEWLASIRRERPSPTKQFKIGIYIRYFNQTKYDDYLDFHKKQFVDTIALCPNWELYDFYIDEGATAPNMETAPAWSKILQDAMDGKLDLIMTQKASNVSRKMYELTFCARLLASQPKPIGIYFISEDIYTLASYYQHDLHDTQFFPSSDWQLLPED